MRTKTIPSDWLQSEGCRLDVGPYMSGALEAKVVLEKLSARKDRLIDLTVGGDGIFHAGRESRVWVDDPEYGVPFLGSTDILKADLSGLSMISKRQVEQNQNFCVRSGWILITRSGTVGRMAYTRSDMDGMACSEHVMRVAPDADKVLPGYLHAYLSSKFGVPLIVSGTYGAIIQHIEPKHIAGLPVPRLGRKIESEAHLLVDSAASLLAEYQALINSATKSIFDLANVWEPSPLEWHTDKSDLAFQVSGCELKGMRAWNFSRRANRIKQEIEVGSSDRLGDLISMSWLRWRKMFKRIDADPEFGIEVITQKPLFRLVPKGRWVSRDYLLNHSPQYLVPDKTILIAKQGTLGEKELYCRCEYITGKRMLEKAYSDHCMRVVVEDDQIHPGYLFAFLRSNAGFRLLRSLSEGAKQQDLHWRTVPELPIPRLPKNEELKIGEQVDRAYAMKNEAVEKMAAAVAFVEKAIEEAA